MQKIISCVKLQIPWDYMCVHVHGMRRSMLILCFTLTPIVLVLQKNRHNFSVWHHQKCISRLFPPIYVVPVLKLISRAIKTDSRFVVRNFLFFSKHSHFPGLLLRCTANNRKQNCDNLAKWPCRVCVCVCSAVGLTHGLCIGTWIFPLLCVLLCHFM